MASAAWALMGGAIDWAALPILVPLYGIEDVEIFIAELVAIRDHVNRQAQASK